MAKVTRKWLSAVKKVAGVSKMMMNTGILLRQELLSKYEILLVREVFQSMGDASVYKLMTCPLAENRFV